jgi:hypothetical protein
MVRPTIAFVESRSLEVLTNGTDTLHENNTYKAIRIIGSGYNLYYSIWCTNEHELYDMDVRHKLTSRPATFH